MEAKECSQGDGRAAVGEVNGQPLCVDCFTKLQRAHAEQQALALQLVRHSMAMARNGALFHTANVDVYLHGIQWHTWGENVGYSPGDVEGLEQAFMDSPPHRGNILNRAFRQVAIGSVRVDGTLWVTVFFFG